VGTISRCALFVIALAAFPSAAFSQTSVCQPIRRGETVTQLARRITGDGRNKYKPWFQIVDASSRYVPKSQYDRIRPGWRACITKAAVKSSARMAPASGREISKPREVASTLPQPAAARALRTANENHVTSRWLADTVRPIVDTDLAPDWLENTLRPIRDLDLTWVWFGAAVMVPLFGLKIADDYVSRRNTRLIVMRHFAHRFVTEFERPLMQQPAEHPVRSRIRLSPARARLQILLAPGDGRRYPNLEDHKKNVEYDVLRIVRLLADESFVLDLPYPEAGWVVVPFRMKTRQKPAGVPCISFL
jgi:hypothetical protein